ncbi:MAG TPA: CU044_2847 family protein [Candidatus Obscuribacterales bacterium]
MTKLVQFDLGDGESILMEVDEVESDEITPVSKSPGEIAAQARQTFSQAMAGVTPMVRSLKARLDTLNDPADEVEVKFSVKLSGEVGAVVTKVGGEATYEITLKWKKQ